MPRTIQADGRTITVPDDATPDEINQIVGPPPAQQTKTASSSSTPQQSWWDRVTAPYTEIHQPQSDTPAHALEDTFSNIGAGGLGVILHPLDTLAGIGKFALRANPVGELVDIAHGRPTVAQEMVDQFRQNPTGMIAAGIGQAGAAPIFEGELKAPVKATRIIPRVARGGMDILAGTTPKVAGGLADTTVAENTTAQAKAAEANAKLQADRATQLQKHFEQTQAIKAQNDAAQAAQSRKAALARGVEQLDPKFQSDLIETEKNVRAQAGAKYDTVRAATAGETVPSASLADAVRTAESKIQGSSENLKVFRDILSKHPEGEPETIPYQGADIPKGHPLYDVLKEGQAGTPATFSDLQGYYSELGDKLASGGLPGDVYQAMKSLQGSIGDLMQQMAEAKGVGPQLIDARNFYRDYMNAFRDSSSPLNKAMNAAEAGHPTKGAIAKFQGMDKSGIETLARYNPELAQRANTIRGYQAEARSIPARTVTPKPAPTLPPAKPPVLADVKKIGLKDIQDAKAAALRNRAENFAKKASLVTAGFGGYELLRSALHGDLGGMAIGAGEIAAPYALSKVITSPAIERWLTAPTPSDIAAIPPDIRAEMPQIVKAAQAQGIKVHPALVALGAQPRPASAQ